MHRTLGKTEIEIPEVMFGTTCLGNLFGILPFEQKQSLIQEWFAHQPAPVAIDAAGKYGAGMALEILGRELHRLGIHQSHVVLNNKLGWRRVPLTGSKQSFEPDAWFGLEHDAVQDMSYEGILRCWDQGCQLLQHYTPQLASIHDPDDYLDGARDESEWNQRLREILEGYRALERLKELGLVGAIGIGAKQWKSIELLCQYCSFDWVMLANSFTIMNHPAELLSFLDSLQARKIGVINSALFQGGFLVGGNLYDYRKLDQAIPADQAKNQWRDRFWQVCNDFGITPFDAAIAFGKSHSAIQSVALSTSQPNRVKGLVDAVNQSPPITFWNALKELNLISFIPNQCGTNPK